MPAPNVKRRSWHGPAASVFIKADALDGAEFVPCGPARQPLSYLREYQRRCHRLPDFVRALILARPLAPDATRAPIITRHFDLTTRQDIDRQLAAFGLTPRTGGLDND